MRYKQPLKSKDYSSDILGVSHDFYFKEPPKKYERSIATHQHHNIIRNKVKSSRPGH